MDSSTSTGKTMTTAAKLATGGIAVAAVIGIGFLPLLPPDPAAVAAAHDHTQQVIAEVKAESEARYRAAYIGLIHARDGDTAGELYERCTGPAPPQRPQNQASCKALLDRLQREDAADAAADAKRKAEW